MRRLPLLLLLPLLFVPLGAQTEWRGPGRLLGDVAAADGSPLAGAEVRVALPGAPPGPAHSTCHTRPLNPAERVRRIRGLTGRFCQ